MLQWSICVEEGICKKSIALTKDSDICVHICGTFLNYYVDVYMYLYEHTQLYILTSSWEYENVRYFRKTLYLELQDAE